MYKVEISVLERIKKHLIKVGGVVQTPEEKKLLGTPALQNNSKIVKENQKLIKFLEDNYYI